MTYLSETGTYLFMDIPLPKIMADLVLMSTPCRNELSIKWLQKRLNQIDNPGFSVQDLYKEGWILLQGDEWRPISDYSRFFASDDTRRSRIVNFLRETMTASEKYRYLKIDVKSPGIQGIINTYGKSLEWFLEQGVIHDFGKEGYGLYAMDDPWKELGSIALSYAWKQEYELETNLDKQERWLDIYGCMKNCWNLNDIPYEDSCDKRILCVYDKCLNCLKMDDITWEDITKVFSMQIRLRSENFSCEPVLRNLEKLSYIERMLELEQTNMICEMSIFRNRCRISYCYDFAVAMYDRVDAEQQNAFRALLSHPLFRLRGFYAEHLPTPIITDCAEDDTLAADACHALYQQLKNIFINNRALEGVVTDFGDAIWDIFYNKMAIFCANNESSIQWAGYFAEWLIVLQQESRRFEWVRKLLQNQRDHFIEEINLNVTIGFQKILEDKFTKSTASCQERELYFRLYLSFSSWYQEAPSSWREALYPTIFDATLRFCNLITDSGHNELAGMKDLLNMPIWKAVAEMLPETKKSESFERLKDIPRLSRERTISEYEAYFLIQHTSYLLDSKNLENIWIKIVLDMHENHQFLNFYHIKVWSPSGVPKTIFQTISNLSEDGKSLFNSLITCMHSTVKIDILFWISYIDHTDIYNACLEQLTDIKLFQNKTGSFSSYKRECIDAMLNLCYQIKCTRSMSLNDVEQKLYNNLLCVVQNYLNKSQKYGNENSKIPKSFLEWLNSKRCLMDILQENEPSKDIQNTTVGRFYHGIKLLNKDDTESLETANNIFSMFYHSSNEGSHQGSYNYMIALAKLSCALIREGKSYKTYLQKFWSVRESLLKSTFSMDPNRRIYICYYYPLLIYHSLDDRDGFWNIYKDMSEEEIYEICTGSLILRQLWHEEKFYEYEVHLKHLALKYGECESVKAFRKQLKEHIVPQFSVTPVASSDYSPNPDDIRRCWGALKNIPEPDLAEALVYDDGTKDFQSLATESRKSGKEVAFLLNTIVDSAVQLEAYSYHLLRGEEQKPSHEDTYTNTLCYFIRQKLDYFGYDVRDQTQNGRADSKEGYVEDSPGNIDLLLVRGNCGILLLEAFKLSSCDTTNIDKHLGKLGGYNAYNADMMVALIYANTIKSKADMWEKYWTHLESLYHNKVIIENGVVIDPPQRFHPAQLEREWNIKTTSDIYLTKIKYCQDDPVSVFHVMIDIRHFDRNNASAKEKLDEP